MLWITLIPGLLTSLGNLESLKSGQAKLPPTLLLQVKPSDQVEFLLTRMVSDAKCPSEIIRFPVSSSLTMAPELACTSASKAWCFWSFPWEWNTSEPQVFPTAPLLSHGKGPLSSVPFLLVRKATTQIQRLHLYHPGLWAHSTLQVEDNPEYFKFYCLWKAVFIQTSNPFYKNRTTLTVFLAQCLI